MLTKRQEAIVSLVKEYGPITGEQIADRLSIAKATLRPDLTVLTQTGYLDAKPRVGYFFNEEKHNELALPSIHHLLVRDYQSIPVVIKAQDSIYEAVVKMFTDDVGTLIVVREQILQGVISRKDLLKIAIGQSDLQSIPVQLAMTRIPHVVTVKESDTLLSAATKMILHEVDSLPVVEENEQRGLIVIGRISKTSITRAFSELGQDLPR
nr:helix-turn-helix transcriptional regulator [Bacilli bacterium]